MDVVFIDKLIRLCIFGRCCIVIDVISLVLSVVHLSAATQSLGRGAFFAWSWLAFNASIHSGNGVAKGHAIILVITLTVVLAILPFLFSYYLLLVAAVLINSLDNFVYFFFIIDLAFLIGILFLVHCLLKVSLLLYRFVHAVDISPVQTLPDLLSNVIVAIV